MPPDLPQQADSRRTLGAVTVVWAIAIIASGIAPYDRLTWWMEVAPVQVVVDLLDEGR